MINDIKRISPWQVNNFDFMRVVTVKATLALNGDTWPIAHTLLRTSQRIK